MPAVRRSTPLVLVLLLGFAVIAVIAKGGSDGQRVSAVFQQAYGLVKGGEVVAGGVHVGSITSVDLGADGLPRVAMELDEGVQLREGARADLRQLSNSGELNRYVLLELGRGAPLRDDAEIASTQTAQPVEVDELLSTLEPRTRSDLREVLASLDRGTVDLAPAFTASLRNSAEALRETSGVLAQVTQDGDALETLVGQGANLSTALRHERPALGATVEELSGFLQTTARRQNDLSAAIERLPAGLRDPRLALERLRGAVPELERLVRVAGPAAGELEPTLRQLIPALPPARRTLSETAALARRSPADLRALERLLPVAESTLKRLTPTLRASLPILDYVRAYTPDFTGLVASWSAMNSSFDAVGHVTRIFSTVGSPPPNTPRPATSGAPGYLLPPYVRAPGSVGGDPWADYESSFLSPAEDR